MRVTEPFVLSNDVAIIPAEELDEETRLRCSCQSGDFVVSKPNSRMASSVVNGSVAALLACFRTPRTILEASLELCLEQGGDPEQVLEEVFGVLDPYIRNRWLVTFGSIDAEERQPALEIGEELGAYKIMACLQVLEDTEVYQVRSSKGVIAALKIARPETAGMMKSQFEHEARILRRLRGKSAPAIFEAATHQECPYLIVQWIEGVWATHAANELRRLSTGTSLDSSLNLCIAIAQAYENLHAHGVLHGDVYPKNVLVDKDGTVTLIDFGASRVLDDARTEDRFRLGVPEYFEPELAKRIADKLPRIASSEAGEQHAVAAMLFLVVTGQPYLDLSPVKDEAIRQIAECAPLRLTDRGIDSWPSLESVFARALSKNPNDRFPNLAEFREALQAVSAPVGVGGAVTNRLASGLDTASAYDLSALNPNMDLPEDVPHCSIAFGAAGIALALCSASAMKRDAKLLTLAEAWARRAETRINFPGALTSKSLRIDETTIGSGSVWFGAPGVYLAKALVSHALGDQAALANAVQAYCDSCVRTQPEDLKTGRAGQLLGCALIFDATRFAFDPLSGERAGPAKEVMELARMQVGLLADHLSTTRLERYQYLGVAHGVAGVLYALLIWSEVSGERQADGLVTACLHDLANRGHYGGKGLRFPISPRAGAGFMESWCHGTPGYVHLWAAAYRASQDPKYLVLAEQTAWSAWLADGMAETLCCGDGGRAYAMLEAYRLTRESAWLERAENLACRAIRASERDGRLALALYKGGLGPHLLAVDLAAPMQASMPIFGRDMRVVA